MELDFELVRRGALEGSGGIGLWTKADAVTVFDDLVVNAAN
jgi:hypothetical protein